MTTWMFKPVLDTCTMMLLTRYVLESDTQAQKQTLTHTSTHSHTLPSHIHLRSH